MKWSLYVFGGILVITAVKLLVEKEKHSDLRDNWATRILKKHNWKLDGAVDAFYTDAQAMRNANVSFTLPCVLWFPLAERHG